MDEFAEVVQKLVAQGYPTADRGSQEEFAAEAFLMGYKNQKVGYEVLNTAPKTLHEAVERVEAYQHNYRATLGRLREYSFHPRNRRVQWADDSEDSDGETRPRARRVESEEPSKSSLKVKLGSEFGMKDFEEAMAKVLKEYHSNKQGVSHSSRVETKRPDDRSERCSVSSRFDLTRSPSSRGCFHCSSASPFKHECPELDTGKAENCQGSS